MSDIDGNGSIRCPECGKAISAKDESDEVYKTETWTIANGTKIVQVDLRCQCGTIIRLEGMLLLVPFFTDKDEAVSFAVDTTT